MPYTFRARRMGESKLDSKVLLDFIELLLARSVRRYVPVRFVMFSLVGGAWHSGAHGCSRLVFRRIGPSLPHRTDGRDGHCDGDEFVRNNVFTYFDRRLRGWQLLKGWISFALASSVGALANVGVAIYLFESMGRIWYASALAGILVGAAWNFAVTALYAWKP